MVSEVGEERDEPRKNQMTETAETMRKSTPSRRRPSQRRSCVENGSELEKRVMYHRVA